MADRIYLDSNIIIYRTEGEPALRARVHQALTEYVLEGAQFFTSELTVGECLIGAYRKSPSNEEVYHSVFAAADFIHLSSITQHVMMRGALLGAKLNMKLFDAIHVATAEEMECSVFLTNDRGIRAPAGIELRYLSVEA